MVSDRHAWIGAYRIGNEQNDFAWEDGSPWSYTNWDPNDYMSSGDQCAYLNYENGDGLWRFVPCNGQFNRIIGFICQKYR